MRSTGDGLEASMRQRLYEVSGGRERHELIVLAMHDQRVLFGVAESRPKILRSQYVEAVLKHGGRRQRLRIHRRAQLLHHRSCGAVALRLQRNETREYSFDVTREIERDQGRA